jgi:hypothetical protein
MQHNSAATMSADIAGLQKEIQNVSLHTHSESGLDHSAAPLWTDIMTRPYNSGAHTAGPVAVLVGVAADSFMFPPELGTESVKNSADALFGPHSPDLDFGEHHADLHFASPELAQNVPSDATASGPPNAPSPHTHDFHLL